jgi:myo-inositol-1(or 4)-monophosphatase
MAQSANMNVMIATARKAGRSLAKDFREVENLQVSVTGAVDFVSRAILQAEEIIKEELALARSTYGFKSEASGDVLGKDPTRRWIVCTLDGITNFLHGMPHYAVSIALEHKGEIVLGVIYDAAKDECFFAEKGQGAWMNETRLRVSGRQALIECVLATGLPAAGWKDLPIALKDLAEISPVSAGIRSWGTTSLDLAYVAAGRYDGFWERGLNYCNIGSGVIIIKEAGGFIEPINPKGNILDDGELICANDMVFPKLSKLIRKSL